MTRTICEARLVGSWPTCSPCATSSAATAPDTVVLPAEDGELATGWIDSVVAMAGPLEPGSLGIHADNGGR